MKELVAVLLIVAFVGSLAGCSYGVSPTPQTKIQLTNDNWHFVLSEAKGAQSAYLGSDVNITGKVVQIVATTSREIQFSVDTSQDTSFADRTLVVVAAGAEVQEGQWVRVRGTLNRYWNTQNLLGAELRIPVVLGNELATISRSEGVPPQVTVTVDKSITQHGLTITVQRVEIAVSETRVYVLAINNSPNKASLYSFDAVLVQGDRQIKRKSMFGEDLQEPDTTLVSGIKTEGILLFDPANPERSPIKLIWSNPRTDNYRLDFYDWEWVISW